MKRSRARLIAPLIACGISGGAAVVGGACVPTSSNPPTLQTGTYTLVSVNGKVPPAVFVDSAGRTLRVVADTFKLAVNQYYDEIAAVAITPRGGTEAAVAPFVVNHQTYGRTSASTVTFLITLYGGSVSATVFSPTTFELQLPDRTVWRYDRR